MKRGRPLKPSEVVYVIPVIPGFVFDAFNDLIALKMVENGSATVYQAEVVALIKKMGRRDVIDFKWLNVEKAYRKAGWIVKYDKPSHTESYKPFFTFKSK